MLLLFKKPLMSLKRAMASVRVPSKFSLTAWNANFSQVVDSLPSTMPKMAGTISFSNKARPSTFSKNACPR